MGERTDGNASGHRQALEERMPKLTRTEWKKMREENNKAKQRRIIE